MWVGTDTAIWYSVYLLGKSFHGNPTKNIDIEPEVFEANTRVWYQFMVKVRHRKEDRLDPWMESAKASGIPALVTFVNGLQKDLAAVRNALRHVWINGQTDGPVNRLKFLKRQMYGRAKFDLLRKHVLPRSAPT